MMLVPAGMEALVALGVLGLLFVGFLLERYPPEVTAAAGAAVFVVLGFVPVGEVFEAFSNPAPITIAAMFVLSGALVRTGVLEWAAGSITRVAGTRPLLALGAFFGAAMVSSAFVNNTPVVLVLIPIAVRLANALGLAPTRLLMPISYAAILGGTCTLIGTSTNLLVDGVSREAGLAPFGIFEIAPVGLVALVAGSATMLLLGRFLLPDRGKRGAKAFDVETEFLSEVAVVSDGFAGLPLGEIAAFDQEGVRVLAVTCVGETHRSGLDDVRLRKGDRLVVVATTSELLTLDEVPGLRVGWRRTEGDRAQAREADAVTAEVVVVPRQYAAGRRIADLRLGRRFGVRILGAHRPRHVPGPDLGNVRMRAGDRLLLEGSPEGLSALSQEADLAAITRPTGRAFRRTKAPIALLALAAVVGLAALGVMDIGVLALIAVAAILVLRCIDADEAWGSIAGAVLILIFAMLVIGRGLENAGAVEAIVGAVAPMLADVPPWVALLAVYALTSTLTELVTNNAVAVVLTPIVVALAQQLGVDPRAFVVAVMMGASASFATPIGYQTNTLVYGAGDYRFSDFLRVGVPMNLIVGAASVAAIAMVFPLQADG